LLEVANGILNRPLNKQELMEFLESDDEENAEMQDAIMADIQQDGPDAADIEEPVLKPNHFETSKPTPTTPTVTEPIEPNGDGIKRRLSDEDAHAVKKLKVEETL
jgi:hypothetical protein